MDYADPHDSGYGGSDSTQSSLHPDRYDHDHISSLEVFSQDLQKAIANSFPRPKTSYSSVHVLLLRWAGDDLNVQKEITPLEDVFEHQYKFNTEQWDIPSQSSTRALQTKLYDFQNCHQSEDELLIVYYGGHGDADRRGRSIWAANKMPDSPTLNWSSLQHLLETAIPHVLIILDCCYAANAARDTSEGTIKELLAACGRENPTLGVGIRSFTICIIEELQAFGAGPFTVSMLHSRLITMRWRLVYTPVYALLSEHGGHSIELAPQSASTPAGQFCEANNSDIDEDMMDVSSPEARVATDTRVLLSVSISDDATCDIAEWKKWLVHEAPLVVTQIEVRVEAVYKSHSAMLIVSMPVVVWNCLPNKAAYRFVGFVKSGNLDQTHLDLANENERIAVTVSSQQREITSMKKQMQLFEDRTSSASDALNKERDVVKDSQSDIPERPKATGSSLLAQQEANMQRQRLSERKEQKWANERRISEDNIRIAEDRHATLLAHQSAEDKAIAVAPKNMKEPHTDARPTKIRKLDNTSKSPKHTKIRPTTLPPSGPPTPDFTPLNPEDSEDSEDPYEDGYFRAEDGRWHSSPMTEEGSKQHKQPPDIFAGALPFKGLELPPTWETPGLVYWATPPSSKNPSPLYVGQSSETVRELGNRKPVWSYSNEETTLLQQPVEKPNEEAWANSSAQSKISAPAPKDMKESPSNARPQPVRSNLLRFGHPRVPADIHPFFDQYKRKDERVAAFDQVFTAGHQSLPAMTKF
ncbi:MAG: hypothetical protein Q9221_001501 [Calogaya cf. arnoldii]